jgi:iron-sulfur cluster repair protein YtfE (RIC family)
MANIPKLRDEHFRLMATVRRLGVLIDRATPPPPLHLFTLRYELSTTLIAHLAEEDSHLYPQLLGSADPKIAATARKMSDAMAGQADAFHMHNQRWTAQAIAGDWEAYCVAFRQVLDALTARISRENRELFPLAERPARAA